MSLPVTNLDDRRFQDLVDEAKRMIPQLCPEWTNHNLSDPGVALIELFAWMTETMLFRLNQVPDVFFTRMLNLLGFEAYPVSAARADLTFWGVADEAHTVNVPAGTQVSTVGSIGATRVFTTLTDAVAVAPGLKGALVADGDQYTDVWESLALGLSPVRVFPGTPMAPGDAFYLGFERSLASNVVRLRVEATAEGIGVVPDRPPLVWEAWQGEGWAPATIPIDPGTGAVWDTTGGLNRDGEVVLMIPPAHEPLTLGGVRAHWVRAKLLASGPDRPAYRSSPQLRRVHADTVGVTVTAEHSEPVVAEVVGRSSGKPDQVFRASRAPVLARGPLETLEVVGDDGTVETWAEVTDFADSDRTSRHFLWDSTTGEIRFGPLIRYPDGSIRQHGAVPPEGACLRLTGYRTGGGAAGNVGANTLTGLRTSVPYVSRVENLAPATGGVDAETVDNAKRRGPQTLRTGGRAVTIADFERLSQEADRRVARVRCLPPSAVPGEGQFGPLRLLVVPSISEPAHSVQLDHFALPDDMIANISGYLDERRVLGTRIEVGTPYYQGVTVAALVVARPGRPPSLVQDRAMRALYQYINPISGGPDGNGWPFDADLNSALVFQVLEAVEGVERVDEVLFFEYDLRNHERIGFGKELVKLAPQSLFLSANHQVVVR
jgi:predicted phage baseplate assembly protein